MTDGTGAVAATTIIVVIMTAGTTIGTGIGGTGTGMSAVTMTGGTRRHQPRRPGSLANPRVRHVLKILTLCS
jgi:hypothetical protein